MCRHRLVNLKEVSVDIVWQKYVERENSVDPHPWWDCADMPPACEEVQKAAEEGRVQEERNDCDQHLRDRQWHIERIAYFMKHWKNDDPIRMRRPIANMEIYDGAHRLMAARFLGKTHILAGELENGE